VRGEKTDEERDEKRTHIPLANVEFAHTAMQSDLIGLQSARCGRAECLGGGFLEWVGSPLAVE
jgi:hypothetical protein